MPECSHSVDDRSSVKQRAGLANTTGFRGPQLVWPVCFYFERSQRLGYGIRPADSPRDAAHYAVTSAVSYDDASLSERKAGLD